MSELKANPKEVINQANGEPVLILRNNKLKAYLVSADRFERMHEELADYALLQMTIKRMGDESIPVNVTELSSGA
ncbi:type II toxin-antitoxin system Phd/YefM family antitoxin [Idiomarina abyssalis]|uniref:type II toxin-antitoxin system Phd/YefM family antitoxin n=1 Tax=Idiomarina abyssalis TaxID=86102 RepID=UPI003A90B147